VHAAAERGAGPVATRDGGPPAGGKRLAQLRRPAAPPGTDDPSADGPQSPGAARHASGTVVHQRSARPGSLRGGPEKAVRAAAGGRIRQHPRWSRGAASLDHPTAADSRTAPADGATLRTGTGSRAANAFRGRTSPARLLHVPEA